MLIFKHLKQIPVSVRLLSSIDGIINISASVIFSLFGIFMKETLRVNPVSIGILEGVVEMLSWSIRLFSGAVSDYFKRRKAIIVLGYLMSLLSRIFFALAENMYIFSLGRLLDRTGKGLQASPTDALIAEYSPMNLQGLCFRLKHTLGILGSVIGCGMAFYLTKQSPCNYRLVFSISAIPIIFSILLLIFFIKDNIQINNASKPLTTLKSYTQFDKQYWYLILFSVVLTLARSSEVFITLHALELRMDTKLIFMIMLVYNISEAITSYSAGQWFDHLNKRLGAVITVIVLIAANLLLGFATSPWMIIIGCILWGVQRTIYHPVILALIAHTAAPSLLGTAYGVFYVANGVALFLTNTISGLLVNYMGYNSMYLAHALLGGISLPFVWFWFSSIIPLSSRALPVTLRK